MTAMGTHATIGADDRYELAARASARERASRPTHLIALSLVLFMIATVALALGWRANTGAVASLSESRTRSSEVERLLSRIADLQAAEAQQTGDDPFRPIPDLLTRLTRIAEEVGLENPLALPENTSPRVFGSSRRLAYPYTIRDSSLERVLEWIERSMDRIPGLRVRELTLTPNRRNWVVQVTLSRYERIE